MRGKLIKRMNNSLKILELVELLTPDNSNLSREIEKISSYWEFEANNR